MCDKQGNSYFVHYNMKEVSDQWAVGPMGCRTNGCRTTGKLPEYLVHCMLLVELF